MHGIAWDLGTGDDFVSLLNTDSSENSGITVETVRILISEIANELSKKLEEITEDLISQSLQSMNSAIGKKVLPTLQNSL